MQKIEQTLSSIEVSEMIEKEHSKLLRDIHRYEEQFIEAKIGFNDFFMKSQYKDKIGRTLPCYRITKKGCDFIAHKLTGTKGTIFTARYINRFHEMQDILTEQQEPELPWFIRRFRGKLVVLWKDFSTITGIDIEKSKPQGWSNYIKGGRDFNGWGWKCDNKKFKEQYGFNYGEEPCMMYFYLCGIPKVLRLIESDKKNKMLPEGKKLLLDGVKAADREANKNTQKQIESDSKQQPIQICIRINGNEIIQQI